MKGVYEKALNSDIPLAFGNPCRQLSFSVVTQWTHNLISMLILCQIASFDVISMLITGADLGGCGGRTSPPSPCQKLL